MVSETVIADVNFMMIVMEIRWIEVMVKLGERRGEHGWAMIMVMMICRDLELEDDYRREIERWRL